MPIPSFQAMLLPLLEGIRDGQMHHRYASSEALCRTFQITAEEREESLSSGKNLLLNRVDWALHHLFKAGLLGRPSRGYVQITPLGREVLGGEHTPIDLKLLRQLNSGGDGSDKGEDEPADTPDERMEKAQSESQGALADLLLETVKRHRPKFFEDLIVDLMIRMGYGNPRAEGHHLKASGDEGIDGIIDQDALGLDTVYLQAKRWSGAVGRPEIQKFVGALHGQKARKGVFITTSSFTNEARTYASGLDATTVRLIDGRKLAELMIDHDVGVTTTKTYAVKRINLDYFPDEPQEGQISDRDAT